MLHFSKMQILGGDNNTCPHCTAVRTKRVANNNISGPRLALSTPHMCDSHYCYLQQCKTSTRFFFLVLCALARKPKLTLRSLLLLNLDCKHAPPPQQDLILSIPLLTLLLINFLKGGQLVFFPTNSAQKTEMREICLSHQLCLSCHL